ncbi:PAC2 family protein [Corynebacterium caspium]|uniref:PAC2 family protein n=1 Tax=Corynebacterium caspium TaxID=234828 RepID=UPI00037EF330|nr:PAC2 family protein [Corynebacterium caspium]WKD59136.1 PAC2 family protein [Corynebacterium caspium DSM 44850]
MNHEERHVYDFEYPLPDVPKVNAEGLTMIVALQGYADAGLAVEKSARHLLESLDNRLLVSFNNDELIDYRSRRPIVTVENNQIIKIDDLELSIRVVRDTKGTAFLLLSGPEPDLRWDSFSRAVADIAKKFGVSRTVMLYAAPMTVPHTRPLVISGHGNARDYLENTYKWEGTVQLPGSASLQLEKMLVDKGFKVAGYTAHVPHYIASSPYPEAILRLLETISEHSHLSFPLRVIEQDMSRIAIQLAEQTEDSLQIQQVVHSLEEQYDQSQREYHAAHPGAQLPGIEQIPSGEEIGKEFEKFLASIDKDNPPSHD